MYLQMATMDLLNCADTTTVLKNSSGRRLNLDLDLNLDLELSPLNVDWGRGENTAWTQF